MPLWENCRSPVRFFHILRDSPEAFFRKKLVRQFGFSVRTGPQLHFGQLLYTKWRFASCRNRRGCGLRLVPKTRRWRPCCLSPRRYLWRSGAIALLTGPGRFAASLWAESNKDEVSSAGERRPTDLVFLYTAMRNYGFVVAFWTTTADRIAPLLLARRVVDGRIGFPRRSNVRLRVRVFGPMPRLTSPGPFATRLLAGIHRDEAPSAGKLRPINSVCPYTARRKNWSAAALWATTL